MDGSRRLARTASGRARSWRSTRSRAPPCCRCCTSRRSRTAGSRPEAIAEVAALVGLEPAQVLGTCSFYTMYKRDGKKQLVVSVCTNVSCLVNGGPELYEALSEQYAATRRREVEEVECLAACDTAPVFQVNYEFHGNATARVGGRDDRGVPLGRARRPRRVRREARPDGSRPRRASSPSGCASSPRTPGRSTATWRPAATSSCAGRSRWSPRTIQDEQVKASGLRGRGGAGFGTGQKWSFLPKGVYPRYLAVNGDEGEPSTFKDHMLIERDPHQIVEGVIISAFAIEAHHAFIYVRGRVRARHRAARAGRRRRVREGLHRQEHPRLRLRPRGRSCTAARARTSPETRPGCCRASRASARCRASSRRSPRCRASTRSRPSSTTSRRCRPSRTSCGWAARSTPSSASAARPARASSRCRVTSSARATTRSSSASRSAT